MYSFGVLLWELATGKRPWAGMMQMQARVQGPLLKILVYKKETCTRAESSGLRWHGPCHDGGCEIAASCAKKPRQTHFALPCWKRFKVCYSHHSLRLVSA